MTPGPPSSSAAAASSAASPRASPPASAAKAAPASRWRCWRAPAARPGAGGAMVATVEHRMLGRKTWEKSLENGKTMGILWENYGENMNTWEFYGKTRMIFSRNMGRSMGKQEKMGQFLGNLWWILWLMVDISASRDRVFFFFRATYVGIVENYDICIPFSWIVANILTWFMI